MEDYCPVKQLCPLPLERGRTLRVAKYSSGFVRLSFLPHFVCLLSMNFLAVHFRTYQKATAICLVAFGEHNGTLIFESISSTLLRMRSLFSDF